MRFPPLAAEYSPKCVSVPQLADASGKKIISLFCVVPLTGGFITCVADWLESPTTARAYPAVLDGSVKFVPS